MVRFKNRWLLVEFVFPSSQQVPAALALSPLAGTTSSNAAVGSSNGSEPKDKGKGKRKAPPRKTSKRKRRDSGNAEGEIASSSDEDDSEASDDDGPGALDDPKPFLHPSHPLLLPPPPSGSGQPRVLGEKAIHTALKASMLQAFGDDGWAKVASNTNVKYYSSQTQTAIIRTSRDHYRLLQAALAFLGPVNNERVIANVLHVSGTIKKIQLRQIAHNRLLVATVLASLALPPVVGEKPLVLPAPTAGTVTPSTEEEEEERERRWRAWEATEATVIGGIID